jgi:hypothetical protein
MGIGLVIYGSADLAWHSLLLAAVYQKDDCPPLLQCSPSQLIETTHNPLVVTA